MKLYQLWLLNSPRDGDIRLYSNTSAPSTLDDCLLRLKYEGYKYKYYEIWEFDYAIHDLDPVLIMSNVPGSKPKVQQKEETMGNLNTFVKKEVSIMKQAAINSGSTLISKSFKKGILELIKIIDAPNYDNYAKVLDTEIGLAIVSMGLGQILENMPYVKDNEYIKQFAEAFKIKAYEIFIGVAMEHGAVIAQKFIDPIITSAQKAIPALKNDEKLNKLRAKIETGDVADLFVPEEKEELTMSASG